MSETKLCSPSPSLTAAAPRFAQEPQGQLPGTAPGSQSDHGTESSEDTSAANGTVEQQKVTSTPSSGQEAQANPNALASLLGYR